MEYSEEQPNTRSDASSGYDVDNHDTIGMIAIDLSGNVSAGTSTNGLNHKVPGQVSFWNIQCCVENIEFYIKISIIFVVESEIHQ